MPVSSTPRRGGAGDAPASRWARLAVLMAALALVVGAATPAAAETVQVSGRVILPDGVDPAVLPEIVVRVSPDGGLSYDVTVGSDGSFTVPLTGPVSLRTVMPATSMLVPEVMPGRITPETAGPGFDFHPRLGGGVAGQVSAPPGVTFGDSVLWLRGDARDRMFRIAPDGTFELRGVAAGRYSLLLVGAGFRYLGGGYDLETATMFTVEPGIMTTGITGQLTLLTQFEETGPITAFRGVPPTVPFTLLEESTGSTPTGDVVLRDADGTEIGRTTLGPQDGGRGRITLATPLPMGEHHVTLHFAGDAVFDETRRHRSVHVGPEIVGSAPVRVLDSSARGTVCVDVRSAADLPEGVTSVLTNVTAARPTGVGYGVVYGDTAGDGTTPAPAGSTVNFEPGADVANFALVAVPPSGRICYATGGGAQVRKIIDVTGFVLGDHGTTPVAPSRVLDTRPGGVGELDGAVTPRTVHTVQVAGLGGVPADATSVLLNATVVGAKAPGNLRVFPGGAAVPNASVVNYAPGQDKANTTLVELVDGKVSFYSDTGAPVTRNPVQVVLDVVGFSTGTSTLTSVAPTRILDSRPGSQVGPLTGRFYGWGRAKLPVAGVGPVPSNATLAVLNVTAVDVRGTGNLRVFPVDRTSTEIPTTSSLNFVPGRDVPNLVVVGIGDGGAVSFYADSPQGDAYVAVDVVGYAAPR